MELGVATIDIRTEIKETVDRKFNSVFKILKKQSWTKKRKTGNKKPASRWNL